MKQIEYIDVTKELIEWDGDKTVQTPFCELNPFDDGNPSSVVTISRPVVILTKGFEGTEEQYRLHARELHRGGFALDSQYQSIDKHESVFRFSKACVVSDDLEDIIKTFASKERDEWRKQINIMRSLFEKEERQKKELDKRIEDYNNLSFWKKLKRGFKV